MNRSLLIEQRKKLHLTQANMAETLEIAESTYREKEKGNRDFTDKEISKIIKKLNIDANVLFSK